MTSPTYDEGIELAAKLYRGRRMAEMALAGDHLPRVADADRPAAEAMRDELRADSDAMTAVTRRGRDEWPASLRAIPWGAGLLGYPDA